MTGKRSPPLYKSAIRRLYWKQHADRRERLLVKGMNRHVIVVRSPDPQVFEEAIFVLKEEYLRGRSADQVLEEAKSAAADYLRKNGGPSPGRRKLWGLLLGLGVLLAAGIVWLALRLAGL